MDPIIRMYDEAWNTTDVSERRNLLEQALADDCELLEPRGRFTGRAAIIDRLAGFTERFPGARVDITSDVDEHNGFARYGWKIVNPDGSELLHGIDIVERAPEGRLRRVVMFFGDLDPQQGTPS